MTIQDIRYKLERKKGERDSLLSTIIDLESQIQENKKSVRAHKK
jgi:hypothetical protein